MAGSVNKVILLGRLVETQKSEFLKKEQRRLGSQLLQVNLGKTRQQTRKRKTDWHKIVIFSTGLSEIVRIS